MSSFFFNIIFSLLVPFALLSQNGLMNISMFDGNGNQLQLAQLGGINQAQISQADLNNDGKPDLFIFDRAGGHMSALSIDGIDSFSLHNEWLRHFPASSNFMLLRDYNCDDIPDIFTYHTDQLTGQVGIKLYQGTWGNDQLLYFTTVQNILHYVPKLTPTPSQISISAIDLPAIDDIDNDGDLDILNFASSGGHIEYSQDLHRYLLLSSIAGRSTLYLMLI